MAVIKTATATATATKPIRGGRKKVPLVQRRRARKLVLQALYQWIMAGADPEQIAKQFHEENEGKMDWEFFDNVFIDIPKIIETLDSHLDPVLDRDSKELDPVEKALLYLGAYELAHRVDVPYKVVINECVELAKLFGATESHKYINGVLDKLIPKLRPAVVSRR